MTKRIAVIGAGTAGAISAAFFSHKQHYKEPFEVEWYTDLNIPTQAVGEGSNLIVPRQLMQVMGFNYNDLHKIDGTFKSGIAKYNWGKTNNYYFHDFPPPSVAYHFNAVMLQKYIRERLEQEQKVQFSDKNVSHNDVDADYIIDCTGRPKSFEDFHNVGVIPVNAVHVTQCFWDAPKFQHTLTIARKYGWVFGIPLTNRCAIGYLYNNSINTIEEIKDDVQNVFEAFGLTPSTTTNSFAFSSYFRKQNYTNRVAYNGNASFFSEPLEATSIGNMMLTNIGMLKIINGEQDVVKTNRDYLFMNQGSIDMIMLHYFAGSIFDTEFWLQAKQKAIIQLSRAAKNPLFANMCKNAIQEIRNNIRYEDIVGSKQARGKEYGTWGLLAYVTNIKGLGITDELDQLLKQFG